MITVHDIANTREDESNCCVIVSEDDESTFVNFKEPYRMMLAWTHVENSRWEKFLRDLVEDDRVFLIECGDYKHLIVAAAKDEFDVSNLILFIHVVMLKISICAGKRGFDLSEPLQGFWWQYLTSLIEYSKEVFGDSQVEYGGYRS